MPTVQLAPVVRQRVFSNLGVVAPGARLLTQRSGTTTNYPTYTTAAGTTAHANPIVASASGLFPAIYLVVGVAYRFTLTESDGSPIWGPNDGVEAGPGSAIINVVEEGAIGDGVTDSAVSLQAAINAAVAAQVPLYLPAGIYLTSVNLTIPGRLVMFGDGKGLSQIRALAGCTTILQFTPVDTQVARSQFWNFLLDGNAIATCALSAQFVTHFTIRSVEIYNCAYSATQAAVVLGGSTGTSGGWNTILDDVEITQNAGDGLKLAGVNNSVLISGGKIYTNGAIGVICQSSAAIKIVGTTIEGNSTTGLFALAGVQNLDIDNCYLVGNAVGGMNFTTPAITVRADIILNGDSRVAMGNAFPNFGVKVANCHNNATQLNDAFVLAIGYDALTVEKCRLDGDQAGLIPVVGSIWSTLNNRAPKLRIQTNSNFGVPLAFLQISGVLSFDPRNLHADTIRVRNYADLELNTWGVVVAGGASTWRRSAVTFNGSAVPVWNLNSTAASTSNVFGVSLDAALYTDLIGKYVMFGMWVKADATDKGANVYVGTAPHGSGNAASTAWYWVSGILLWPASGTLVFGVQKNGAATGDVYAALPILMELGAEYYTLFGQIVPQTTFAGTAKPTTGVWATGDQIRYTSAAAAAPPGAYCTAGGTPGTWKSLAVIEA